MASFSSLLSSIGSKPQAPQTATTNSTQARAGGQTSATNGTRVTANNAVAGVKRKSEEPEHAPRPKTARTESDGPPSGPTTAASSSRFQLSARAGGADKSTALPSRPTSKPSLSSTATQKHLSKPEQKPNSASPISPATPNSGNAAPKRGFASVLEKAKAAQEAAKASGASGIKHKPVEKMTKRERTRMLEEAKEKEQAAKRGKAGGSRSNTPVAGKPGFQKPGQDPISKAPVKKAPAPLSYKGTMRTATSAQQPTKKKRQREDEYRNWSDLSDEEEEGEIDEDDDPEGYDSDGSSDMEGGFDDVQREEEMAARAARQEDLREQQIEEAARREKAERKRKLEALSKSRAGSRKY